MNLFSLSQKEYVILKINYYMIVVTCICIFFSLILNNKLFHWLNIFFTSLCNFLCGRPVNIIYDTIPIYAFIVCILFHVVLIIYFNYRVQYYTHGYYNLCDNYFQVIKFNIRVILVIVYFLVLDLFNIVYDISSFYYIFLVTTVLIYSFYSIYYDPYIFKVKLLDRRNVTNNFNNIINEEVIKINLCKEEPIIINEYDDKLYVSEDNNILLLGKNKILTIDKYKIESIEINKDIHIFVVYNKITNQWERG